MSRCLAPQRGLVLGLLMFIAGLAPTTARHWTNVVDPGIYKWMDMDVNKLLAFAEADPFQAAPSGPAPTATPGRGIAPTYEAPTPTVSSTIAPTAVWENVNNNGGCPAGQVLHQVLMRDAWGDGWDNGQTKLKITRLVPAEYQTDVIETIETEDNTTVTEVVTVNEPQGDDPSFPKQVFEGTLETGSEGYGYACLERDYCYQIAVDGGRWMREVSWSIRQVQLGVPRDQSPESLVVAKGMAPETCSLSLADPETGEYPCPITCGIRTSAPTAAPTTADINNLVGDEVPTIAPSGMPSDFPSLVPSGVPSSLTEPKSEAPSDAPSLVPTGAPSEAIDQNGLFGGGFGFRD